jgi:hypothetical protein
MRNLLFPLREGVRRPSSPTLLPREKGDTPCPPGGRVGEGGEEERRFYAGPLGGLGDKTRGRGRGKRQTRRRSEGGLMISHDPRPA